MIPTTLGLCAVLGLASTPAAPSLAAPERVQEHWRAWLESPGGKLEFRMDLRKAEGGFAAWISNGTERIEVDEVRIEDGELTLEFEHYDSTLRARFDDRGARLDGEWTKPRGPDRVTRMSFHALASPTGIFPRPDAPRTIDGRYSVQFEKDEDPAVGIFRTLADGRLQGTFLTTLGDYRFLSGALEGDELELSCFDGAHAFLFRAKLGEDGTLRGDFWSRDSWHETWTAVRDESAELPDAFGLNEWNEDVPLDSLVYEDLDGNERALDDPAFAGRARIVEVFGTWCPNCNDEAAYLTELHRRFGPRGLSVLGLAFELTGDRERDARQVRRYVDRYDVGYPVLLAGTADKKLASERFPLLDRVKSYPTTIFLDSKNRIRAVYTGFSGPATGEFHERLRERFERLIESLLDEAP